VWRIYDKRGRSTADLLSLEHEDPRTMERILLRHPTDHTKYRTIEQKDVSEVELLLVEVLKEESLCARRQYEEMRRLRAQMSAGWMGYAAL
jgi:nicotinate phosphoribosyltransferase